MIFRGRGPLFYAVLAFLFASSPVWADALQTVAIGAGITAGLAAAAMVGMVVAGPAAAATVGIGIAAGAIGMLGALGVGVGTDPATGKPSMSAPSSGTPGLPATIQPTPKQGQAFRVWPYWIWASTETECKNSPNYSGVCIPGTAPGYPESQNGGRRNDAGKMMAPSSGGPGQLLGTDGNWAEDSQGNQTFTSSDNSMSAVIRNDGGQLTISKPDGTKVVMDSYDDKSLNVSTVSQVPVVDSSGQPTIITAVVTRAYDSQGQPAGEAVTQIAPIDANGNTVNTATYQLAPSAGGDGTPLDGTATGSSSGGTTSGTTSGSGSCTSGDCSTESTQLANKDLLSSINGKLPGSWSASGSLKQFNSLSDEISGKKSDVSDLIGNIKSEALSLFGLSSSGVGSLPCGSVGTIFGTNIELCLDKYRDSLGPVVLGLQFVAALAALFIIFL